jgi:hypothetical protein
MSPEVYVSPELYTKLEAEAKKRHITVDEFAEQLFRKYKTPGEMLEAIAKAGKR